MWFQKKNQFLVPRIAKTGSVIHLNSLKIETIKVKIETNN